MKKYLLILIISLGSFSANAQDADEAKRAEKIQALKIAFITQKLKLTPEEAQKFWPVYSQYETEKNKILGDNSNPDVLGNEEKILNIRKKYRPEFEKVLGKPRMNEFFIKEKEFRIKLMQQLKKGNQQQKNKGNPKRPPRKR